MFQDPSFAMSMRISRDFVFEGSFCDCDLGRNQIARIRKDRVELERLREAFRGETGIISANEM